MGTNHRKAIKGFCLVCGKPCAPHERNVDGTYLHTVCAMQTAGSANILRSSDTSKR